MIRLSDIDIGQVRSKSQPCSYSLENLINFFVSFNIKLYKTIYISSNCNVFTVTIWKVIDIDFL